MIDKITVIKVKSGFFPPSSSIPDILLTDPRPPGGPEEGGPVGRVVPHRVYRLTGHKPLAG